VTHHPVSLAAANAIVEQYHRHNVPTVGHRFAIAAYEEGRSVGVAIVGRPVARALDQEGVAEITRVCSVPDAPRNTNSYLYGACRRIWQAMGGSKLITYTLASETGASLRGSRLSVGA
jgi:hypothetical protein